MNEKSEKFLRYSPKRDVVFVLGAGASHPDGVPLQRHILPMIISGAKDEILKSEMGQDVINFIKDNFDFNSAQNQYPQLEAVFGFLDYFIAQNESLNSNYNNVKIRELKEYLIKLIHYIVNLRTHKNSQYYELFWKAIHELNSNISIITLNYDTLLEQAFDFLFPKDGIIDYCIHFMNYNKSEELKDFNFWLNPREPVFINPGENPVPYKILKLHGSLNWKYCNCCNQTLLTPWDRDIELQKGKFLGYTFPEKIKYEYLCPNDGTEFQTLILPPSHLKILTQPVISELMREASREIRSTRKIIFIGYSLSDADIHVKALFKKHLKPDYEIIVINTRNAPGLKQKYRALSNNIRFINSSFEETVNNPTLLEELIS